MGWHRAPLVGFDLETTGTDPDTSRIVTAALTEVRDGVLIASRDWLVNPGVPIPKEAVAIHGVSTERAVAEGRLAREAVEEIAASLVAYWAEGTPVVAFNAPFDLGLLAAELTRYGLPSLAERLPDGVGPVIDPLTVDRAVDRYRKGRRGLDAACAEYGVVLDSAHEAVADALAAVRVAVCIAERHLEVAERDPWDLHHAQVAWYADWAANLQAWRRRRDPGAVVEAHWPLRESRPAAESG